MYRKTFHIMEQMPNLIAMEKGCDEEVGALCGNLSFSLLFVGIFPPPRSSISLPCLLCAQGQREKMKLDNIPFIYDLKESTGRKIVSKMQQQSNIRNNRYGFHLWRDIQRVAPTW